MGTIVGLWKMTSSSSTERHAAILRQFCSHSLHLVWFPRGAECLFREAGAPIIHSGSCCQISTHLNTTIWWTYVVVSISIPCLYFHFAVVQSIFLVEEEVRCLSKYFILSKRKCIFIWLHATSLFKCGRFCLTFWSDDWKLHLLDIKLIFSSSPQKLLQ